MSWKIFYTSQARQDLKDIFEYISNELFAPDTAANQSRRIIEGIRELEEMPLRHCQYEDEPWNSMKLRFFTVDNYVVFYLPKEEGNVVNIVRIMYGGRDIQKQLSETIEF